MKKFLLKVVLFAALLLTVILAVFFIADGKSDSYYVRFTSGRQHSLIIGTSRSAQGLQPDVLNAIVYKNKEQYFFNYSFSLNDSPYGPAYLESIKKKLDPDTKDGIFIVTVDPWGISANTENPNDSAAYQEQKSFMGKTAFVSLNPNIPYLVQSYGEPYINIIRKWRAPADMYLHKDGWLQIDVPMDSTVVAQRLETKLKDYRANFLPVYKFSSLRLDYLYKTISFLKGYGKVYLVRLPVQQTMFGIEDELMPDFDDKIDALVKKENLPYLNFKVLENNYQYVDGNHLYKTSGKAVSAIVGRWIASMK